MISLLTVMLLVIGLISPAVHAATTTAPSLASIYSHLNDPDFQVRNEARWHLLDLPLDHLAGLPDIMTAHPPTPAQISPIREAVINAFLRAQTAERDETKGFLGVALYELTSATGGRYAVVQSCVAGYIGSRRLCDGDIILSVTGGSGRMEIDSLTKLQQTIAGYSAGTPLQLVILRGGHLLTISVVLDATPMVLPASEADPRNPQAHDPQSPRLKAAQEYWEQHFASLHHTP